MRAVVCTKWGGPDDLELLTLPDPVAAPGQVVLKVLAAGVNFPDVLIIQNKYQVKPELPFIPGAEVAGEVLHVGAGVKHLAVGDRVAGICNVGGFAEQVAVDAAKCMKIPVGLDQNVAAGILLAYGTSWHALQDRAALRPGETLLVLGAAGGVGLAAVEIGKAMGARIVAAASTEDKCALCTAHGADAVINYTAEDLRAGVKRTCGAGPDVIFDPVGGDFSEPAFRSIGWRGRHLVIGFAGGDIPAIPLNLTLLKGASLVGVFWGAYTQREPQHFTAGVEEMVRWILDGRLKPLVSRTYQLEDTPMALKDMAARLVTGKIVVTP